MAGRDPSGESLESLRAQLATAVEAARDAYRQTTGLIRLLTVIGQPVGPEDLVNQTLTVLSDVFTADVTCLAQVLSDRLLVRASCGLAEDDRAFRTGWAVDAITLQAFAHPRAAVHSKADQADQADQDASTGQPFADQHKVPIPLARLGARSAAWVPLQERTGPGDELLLLYRLRAEPFTPADLQVLRSVADRLRLAVESRERSAAIERLAESGHRLARHLDPDALLDDAAGLLRNLTGADSAWVVSIEGHQTALRASHGEPPPAAVWPRPAPSLPGWPVLAQGLAYVDHDPSAGHPLAPPDRRARALAGVPVIRDGTPVAALYVARHGSRPFSRDTAEMAMIFANYLGAAMTNAELYLALARSEASLRLRATHDPLTGLANRVLARQRLDEALAKVSADHVGVLFCDLDRFKAINDRLGHEAGDELLRDVAARLRTAVRRTDVLARFGGDEFVVVLDGVVGVTQVAQIARQVLRSLDEPFAVCGERVRISASIGGILGARGVASAKELLRGADAALYVAKERGSGNVEVFDDAAARPAR